MNDIIKNKIEYLYEKTYKIGYKYKPENVPMNSYDMVLLNKYSSQIDILEELLSEYNKLVVNN